MNDQPPLGTRADDHAPYPAQSQPPYSPPPQRQHSFFWPLVLITVGVVWLLTNLNIIAPINLTALFRLWPVILIAIGLDILFGRRWPFLGALIGLGLVALIVALLAFGPAWGLAQDTTLRTQNCAHALGGATSARINLDLSSAATHVTGLSDSTDLIDATFKTVGDVRCDVSGESEKTVRVSQSSNFNIFVFPFGDADQRWDIGLSPNIPLALNVDSGSGSVTLDLDKLQLRGVDFNSGSGSVDMRLPESREGYAVDLNSGSGSIRVMLPAKTNITVQVDSGSGSVTLDVPDGAAVKIDVRSSGSGRVNLPGGYERTGQGNGDEGTWQTANFGNAERTIVITVNDLGSGSINVQ
jgi:hypothetical protein